MLRINLRRGWSSGKRHVIFRGLVENFCDEYDMNTDSLVSYLSHDEDHLNVLIDFLRQKGYKVTSYSLQGTREDVLSWGLEFTDDCENTVALKLQHL